MVLITTMMLESCRQIVGQESSQSVVRWLEEGWEDMNHGTKLCCSVLHCM
jgi:hypothetical protein